MLNVNDPIIKRFKENLHNSIERRILKLSSPSSYDDYILENRLIKFFCEGVAIDPRNCAEVLNFRYGYFLDGNEVIKIMRFLHLSYQSKRAELFYWAKETAEVFVKALEFRTPEDFKAFIALRDKKITDRDGTPFKIQLRVLCLMLYVKHPELCIADDLEKIERFGNAHMKYFFFDAVDFLRNICINNRKRNCKKAAILTMSLKDFLSLVYAEYPALAVDAALLEGLDSISVMQFFNEVVREGDSPSGMTVEEFLQNDPDADSLLIPLSIVDSVCAD